LANRNWTLVLGGRGEPAYEQGLRTLYTDPRIRFLGFVEPAELLSRIDVLVVPSLLQEPFGRVLIEAYGHGVAVIGSRRGGIPEVIEDGETGLIFEPKDPASLSRAIATLLDDPEKVADMKAGALARATSRFSPTEILRQYRSVYGAVTAGLGQT
jgi:glycosyltransferase involved in cell wall biosynthesis